MERSNQQKNNQQKNQKNKQGEKDCKHNQQQ